MTNINDTVARLQRIRNDIRRSWKYPACPQLRLEFDPWRRREHTAENESCRRAANQILHFLNVNIWNIEKPETQKVLKAMQVTYMDMLGMPVYPEGRAWPIL